MIGSVVTVGLGALGGIAGVAASEGSALSCPAGPSGLNISPHAAQRMAELRDLAHDLDDFEADPSLRAEDNSFFDEERLKAEIDSAINNIRSLAGCGRK